MSHLRTVKRLFPAAVPIVFMFVVALLLPAAVKGQVLYGSLTGNVTDQKGASVPAVKIEARDLGTGATRETSSDENGGYQISGLQPGIYNVTYTLSSFKTVIQENVRIEANALRRLDVELEVADVKETVVVTQEVAPLQTDRADVTTQLQAKLITDLPIATAGTGRNYQGLYRIVPGFSAVTEGVSSDGGNPQRSMTGNVNGNSMQANLTRIDGASNAYIWLPFNTAYVPPTESIESVSIVTNSYDAEQGNANGAAVNVVTKSGTNEFHGSLFEFHTDNALKALNRFARAGDRNPKYILNQFGGAIGGPIYLPRFGEGPAIWSGKNKLFFFTDWEWTKRRQFATRATTVMNPAAIFDAAGNADLSAAIPAGTNCNVTPVAGCVFDPNTGNASGTGRLAFPGNIIPANRINASTKLMLSRINPAGFINNQGVTATNNYISAGSASLDRRTFDIKINYLVNDRTSIFGRYSRSDALLFDPPTLGDAMGGATGGGQVGEAPSKIQSVGLGGTHTFSATLVMDANFGYTRQKLGAVHQPDISLGSFGINVLQIPGTNGDSTLTGGTPAFIFPGSTWNGIGNVDTGNPFQFRDNQFVGNANMSWTRGTHGIRFGIEYNNAQLNHFQPQGGAFGTPRGSFNFAGSVTALSGGPAANKANILAQYLLGFPDRVGKVIQNSNPNALRWHTWSAYVRDQWQATPDLTLNLGVRWEYYPFPTTDHGGVKLFNPATGNVLIGGNGNTPIDNGVEVGLGQLAPRFGLAYRWGDKTVIRAGYGMTTDSNNWRFFRNNWPLVSNADLQGTTAFVPAASLTGATLAPYPGLFVGIPPAVVPDLSSGNVPLPNNTGIGGATIPFDFNRGYVHSYNLTIQREFLGLVGEVAYVGNRAIRFLTNENINAAPVGGGQAGRPLFVQFGKNWGDVGCLCPDTNSYYDALQAKLNRRYRDGLTFGVAYAFSKAINSIDNEEVSGTFGVPGGFLFWPHPSVKHRNKALASYDRTHNLSIYGSYELPFGSRKRWAKSGILGAIAGGWQVNWLMQTFSGSMFTLFGGGTQVNAPGNQQTPDQVGPLTIIGGVGPRPGDPNCAPTDLQCHYFDPSAFRAVPPSEIRFGTTGRNIIRGPGFFNLDGSIFRNFNITETVELQFRMEMFGVTNTPHLNNPGTDVTNPATFGVITSTLNLAGRGTGTGGERQVWFGAKLIF